MGIEDYIKILKCPDTWFRQAFAQKMVADKILADIIMNKDFLRSLKKTPNLLTFSTLNVTRTCPLSLSVPCHFNNITLR